MSHTADGFLKGNFKTLKLPSVDPQRHFTHYNLGQGHQLDA